MNTSIGVEEQEVKTKMHVNKVESMECDLISDVEGIKIVKALDWLLEDV